MNAEQRKLWGEAATKGWLAYIDNRALDVMSLEESRKVRQRLALAGELDKILQPRFVLTDKHDGVRTASHPLPVKASARIVVPGFRDSQSRGEFAQGCANWIAFGTAFPVLCSGFSHGVGAHVGGRQVGVSQRRSVHLP